MKGPATCNYKIVETIDGVQVETRCKNHKAIVGGQHLDVCFEHFQYLGPTLSDYKISGVQGVLQFEDQEAKDLEAKDLEESNKENEHE